MTQSIGTHLIADINEVSPKLLGDRATVASMLVKALKSEQFTILNSVGHDFPGGGFTTLILLSESHASLHSYPELGYLAFDLFSCGQKSPEKVLNSLMKDLGTNSAEINKVKRDAKT